MRTRELAAALLVTVAAVGCAKNGSTAIQATHAPSSAEFEKLKDPPITADTHYAAAQLAVVREQYPQARVQYEACLKLNPNHLGALYGIACLHTKLRQFPEAIEAWQKYVKATGGSAIAYSDLAYCEELANNPVAAEQDYLRGIKKDPTAESCRVNYGLMLTRQDRIAEATLQFQTVLSSAEVHYNIAAVYESQGRKEQARLEYEKAIELDPSLNDARTRLAALN